MNTREWAVVHADGSVCLDDLDDEDLALATVHFFDSDAATGGPMSCSPHFASLAPHYLTREKQ